MIRPATVTVTWDDSPDARSPWAAETAAVAVAPGNR